MTKNIFRALVILSIVIFFAAGAIVFYFNQILPPELNAFIEAEYQKPITAIEYILLAISLLALSANIGLLFFARWSRPVYAAGVAILVIATAFTGPSVETALESFVYEVGLLLDGFIIALAYYSDARLYFGHSAT